MPFGVALWAGEVFVKLDEILNSKWEESTQALNDGEFFTRMLRPTLSGEMMNHVAMHWLGTPRTLGVAPDKSSKSTVAWFSQPAALRKEVLKKTLLTALEMAATGEKRKPIQTLLACFRSELPAAEAGKPAFSERFDAMVQNGPNQVTVVLFCSPIPEAGSPLRGAGEAAVIGEKSALQALHWLDWGKEDVDDAQGSSGVVVTRFEPASETQSLDAPGKQW